MNIQQSIESLVYHFNYKKLPKDLSNFLIPKFIKAIPDNLKIEGNNTPLYTRKGLMISSKYNRIVVGDYGPFLEVEESDIVKSSLKIKEGQEWRITDPYYTVKYYWYTTIDGSDIKIYFQVREVSYADYKIGKYYISPFDVEVK